MVFNMGINKINEIIPMFGIKLMKLFPEIIYL